MPAKFGGTLNRPQGQQLHPEAQSRIPERVPGADDSGAPRAFSDLEGDVTGDPGANTVEALWNLAIPQPVAGDDEKLLAYENTGTPSMKWVAPGSTTLVVQEGDTTVEAVAATLDFGAGFDVTSSPAGEANIGLDLAEVDSEWAQGDIALSGTQNNVALPTPALLVRFTSASLITVTGFVAPTKTRLIYVVATGVAGAVINNQDAGSTDVNRIITGTGANITMAMDDMLCLVYDLTTQRWRVL